MACLNIRLQSQIQKFSWSSEEGSPTRALMSWEPREMTGQAQAVPSLTKAQSYSTWTRQVEHV